MSKLEGHIDDWGRPLVRLLFFGAEDEILAHIDTGFNGHILLNKTAVDRLPQQVLGKKLFYKVPMRLATGGIALADIYEAHIEWCGQNRRVPLHVCEPEQLFAPYLQYSRADAPEALIGTGLLSLTRLEINFPKKSVLIVAE